jgi:glucans biosynthesis protein
VRSRLWLLLAVTAITAAVLQHSSALSPQRKPSPQLAVVKFGFDNVQRFAQQRADEAYRDQSTKLPDSIAKLSYDDYRTIQFRADNALWRNQAMFEVQFFHRGSSYDRRVNVTEVAQDGSLRPVNYSPSQFDYGKVAPPKDLPADLGFAGLRVHYPLQHPDYKDELIAFLGASYFRVLGRDQSYGASARGLAINVASTAGEEYPYFTDFWLVQPTPDQRTLTVYALLGFSQPDRCLSFRDRPRCHHHRGGVRHALSTQERRQVGVGTDDIDVLVRRRPPAGHSMIIVPRCTTAMVC